jgi:hypothetical protein
MDNRQNSRFKRHPVAALLALNAGIFLFLVGLGEVALRIVIPFNPGYYVAVEGDSRELVYPYGTIYINSDGFADSEFDLTNPNRIGYFGDSVTYGTGAGYGYRVSEFLQEAYPTYEHMNFGGIDLSASRSSLKNFVDIADKFELDKAIYLFNLNDLLPEQAVAGTQKNTIGTIRTWVQQNLDWLRGQSYVYTYVRNLAKSALVASGTGWLGYPTYEHFPSQYENVVEDTAKRVNLFGEMLAAEGVDLIVVMLPYEMQISQEAADTYADLGIRWEPAFLEGSTQRMLAARLNPEIPLFDARLAYLGEKNPESARRKNHVGEFFVYNKGDKLDWNHPNRVGHRRIADYLVEKQILGKPTSSATRNDR